MFGYVLSAISEWLEAMPWYIRYTVPFLLMGVSVALYYLAGRIVPWPFLAGCVLLVLSLVDGMFD